MNPILQSLADQVTQTTTVEASAKVLIDGFTKRMTDAIAAAVANGASADEIAPVQKEVDAMKQSSADLATSVAANTPAAPATAARAAAAVKKP